MTRVAVIGYGAIGRSIVEAFPSPTAGGLELVGILLRDRQIDAARGEVGANVLLTSSLDSLMAMKPDIVVEAAGHQAVTNYGPTVLAAGVEYYVLSVGSLAQPEVMAVIEAAAASGKTQVILPAGAMAGFDGLLSLRAAGLRSVVYTSTKPPHAWRGTHAETKVDLGKIIEATEIMTGTAREIAVLFPQNANLAAAVALAGLGFDETRIRLVADPDAKSNIGRIDAESARGRLEVILESSGSADNPKTSEITGFSVVAALANRQAAIRFM